MDYNLLLEIHIFFTLFYGGLIGGLIYDIYKSISYSSKSKLIKHLIDILFWIFISFLFFIITVKNNLGQVRGHLLLAFVLGIFIYMKIFSKFIYPLISSVFSLLIKSWGKIINIILYPFKGIGKAKRQVAKAFGEIKADFKRFKRIITRKK